MRTVALFLLLAALPALASEPGQPLDCSDFVVLEPGYTCSGFLPLGWYDELPWMERGANRALDNDGRLLILRTLVDPGEHLELRARSSNQEVVIGYFPKSRPGLGNCTDKIEPTYSKLPSGCSELEGGPPGSQCELTTTVSLSGPLVFDPINGRLLVSLQSHPSGCGTESYLPNRRYWIAAIEGFTTLFEILQTYTPTSDLSFRVPAIPEGFPAADYFDTYYGDLATVGDWTQAQPLQCGYPASPPSVGDYLEVEDPLPNPDPGHGRYYVTAVHYEGQTRYGRKAMGGVLNGTDPAVLPACTNP